MIKVYAWLPAQPLASVADTEKVKVPDCEGDPFRLPPDESVTPAGSVPAVIAKVYGAVPPVAVIGCEYAEPVVPFGKAAGDSIIVGQVTVRLNPASVVAPQLSVACIKIECVPAGFALVKLISPVEALTVIPPV